MSVSDNTHSQFLRATSKIIISSSMFYLFQNLADTWLWKILWEINYFHCSFCFLLHLFYLKGSLPLKHFRTLFALTVSFPPEFLILFPNPDMSKVSSLGTERTNTDQCNVHSGTYLGVLYLQCFHQSCLASSWKLGILLYLLIKLIDILVTQYACSVHCLPWGSWECFKWVHSSVSGGRIPRGVQLMCKAVYKTI